MSYWENLEAISNGIPVFGFVNTNALAYEGVPAEYFFVLPFDDSAPQGMVVFHEGFNAAPVSQTD